MAKLFLILFLVFNFASYVLAHGGCGPSDLDSARCELGLAYQDACSGGDDTHEDHKTESNSNPHLCGCASVFVQANYPEISSMFDPIVFSIQKSKVAKDQFRQRIDRPPIRFG